MMKLKHVFFITFLCMNLNIVCSNLETTVHQNEQRTGSISSDKMPPLIALSVNESTPQDKNSNSIFSGWFGAGQVSTPPKKTSTAATEAYYGAQRILGGRSATAIFHDKHKNGTLKGDLQNQPTIADNDLNLAMNQRIMDRDPNNIENQRKTAAVLTGTEELSEETGITFALAPTSASHLKRKLHEDIKIMTQNAAAELEEINEEYSISIHNAATHKNSRIQTLLDLGKCAASNFNKLHKMSQEKDSYNLTEDIHYTDLNAYQAHLKVNANQAINPVDVFTAQSLQNNETINTTTTKLRIASSAMASVIRNKRKNNTAPDEFDKIIDVKHFESNTSYVNLLATIENKKNKK